MIEIPPCTTWLLERIKLFLQPLGRVLWPRSRGNCFCMPRERGNKYIDFVMGWCVGNFGWRNVAIAKAIERFKGPDYVYPGYSYAGASDNRQRIKNPPPQCGKNAPPLEAKALRRIEQRLKRRDVAAFIMEPISINLERGPRGSNPKQRDPRFYFLGRGP